jgi:hypothetical protein
LLRTYIGERIVFSINGVGKIDLFMNQNGNRPYLSSLTKINLKYIISFNVTLDTMKLVGENRGHWNGQEFFQQNFRT